MSCWPISPSISEAENGNELILVVFLSSTFAFDKGKNAVRFGTSASQTLFIYLFR